MRKTIKYMAFGLGTYWAFALGIYIAFLGMNFAKIKGSNFVWLLLTFPPAVLLSIVLIVMGSLAYGPRLFSTLKKKPQLV